jgi:hypothetical protein
LRIYFKQTINSFMRTILFPSAFYYSIVAILIALLIYTLPHRVAHFDDAWGAELAYWLVKDGYVHSELFKDLGDGSGQHAYVFHKAFTYLQASLMYIFGFGLYAAKSMGLIFSISGLCLLLHYFRGQSEARWLATILYLGCGALVSAAFIGRPEPLAMSAGLSSFLVLRNAQGKAGRLAIAGLLGGLAGLAHLHALIFLMASGLWLLLQRTRLLSVSAFGTAGTLMMVLYPLDSIVNHQFLVLLHQFTHAPVTQANQHGWAKLIMLARYQEVYFHSEGEAALTVLLLLLTALVWRRGAHKLTGSQQYLVLLILSFWALCTRADGYYFLLVMPFIIIVAVELIMSNWSRLAIRRQIIVRVLLAIYPLGACVRVYHLWHEKQNTPWPATENAHLAHYMPKKGTIVVVPLDFFFNEVGHYQLRGLTAYALRNRKQYHDTLSVAGFFTLAMQDSAQYIVTDHRDNEAFHVPATAPIYIGDYVRVFQDRWHSVYSRLH